MNLRFACITTITWLLSAMTLCNASTLYSNGPINGTTDAWTINFGFVVSNSFSVLGGPAAVNGLAFGAWLFPGDVLQSAEVSITESEFGAQVLANWEVESRRFWQVVPLEMMSRLSEPLADAEPARVPAE